MNTNIKVFQFRQRITYINYIYKIYNIYFNIIPSNENLNKNNCIEYSIIFIIIKYLLFES